MLSPQVFAERPARRWLHGDTNRSDEGAILVVWAVALVAIMGLVAMAIDLGNIAQTKQHTSNAAQAAVLSAVDDLVPLAPGGNGVPAVAEQAAVTDAENYLHANYPNLPSASDSSAAATYDSCPGATLPSGVFVWPTASCFGFFNPANPSENQTAPNAMAVAVPAQTVNYTFGRVVGLKSQRVSSVAYASIQTALGDYVLPFGYPSYGADISGSTGLNCLKTNANGGNSPNSTPCPGFALGNGQYGLIINPRYQILADNPSGSVSTSSSNNSDVLTNEILGIDHSLYQFGVKSNPFGSTATVCDWPTVLKRQYCQYDDGSRPYIGGNQVYASTGDAIKELGAPLFDGGVSAPSGNCTLTVPRLSHPYGFQAVDNCPSDNPTSGPTFVESGSYGPTTVSTPCLDSKYGDTYGDISYSDCSTNSAGNYSLNGLSIAAYLENNNTVYTTCENLPHDTSKAIDVTTDGSVIGSRNWNYTSLYWYNFDQCLSTGMSAAAASTSAPGYALSSPLFSSNIEDSPRFGMVPVLNLNQGKNFEQIEGFLGVYLDIAYPQAGFPGALMAWVFPMSWIDSSGSAASQSGSGTGQEIGGNYVTNLCAYGVNC